MRRFLLIYGLVQFGCFAITGQSRAEVDSLLRVFEKVNKVEIASVDFLNSVAQSYSTAYPILMIQFCDKALTFSQSIEYEEGEAQTFLNLSAIYRTKGDLTKGLENGILAYSAFQSLNDLTMVARSYNAIANCYRDLGRMDSSLQFLTKAARLNTNDLMVLGNTLNALGSTYLDMEKYDSAEKYYKKSIEIREEIRDLNGLGVTYGNLGIIAIERNNDVSLANYWYDRSIAIKKSNRDFFHLAYTYINKGNLYRNIGEYELARNNYRKAAQITDSINAKGVNASVYRRWARSEKLAGNDDLALEFARRADRTYISVLEERQSTELYQLSASYELNQKKQ